ncbi:AAA family ATPase [Nostoc ellipsosporum NOK]|nr:AAA family ATPase [Nostoc ellipsosporum NOK]
MTLKELRIDGYKNLQEHAVFNFENTTNYVALVGLNGSGKSNVLEAVAKIFYSFQYKDPIEAKADGGFDFLLRYEIGGKNVILQNNKVTIQGRERKRNIHQILPTEVIACYSGEETRLWDEIFAKPYLDYFKRIRQNFLDQKLTYLYINRYNWETALLTLLCHSESKVKTLSLLGLNTDVDIDIDFKFPVDYDARKSKFEATGINQLTVGFTDRLKEYQEATENGEGVKVSQIDSMDLGEEDNNVFCQRLFNFLFLSTMPKTKKLISNINIRFNNKNVKSLSEGEKKIILISLISNVLAGRNSIVLLDEPDAHVHLEKKKNILDAIRSNNHLSLFTTHSPTLCKYCQKDNVFQIINGTVTPIQSLYEAIEYLIDEDDVLKTMFSSNDIIICEGKTDDIYITKALDHFREEYPLLRFDFMRVGGTDADNIRHVVNKFAAERNKKIIILVDRDSAGMKVFAALFPESTKQKQNIDYEIYNGQDNVYFLMVPTIDPANSGGDFQIENYFLNVNIKSLAKSYIDATYLDNAAFTNFPNVGKELKEKLLKDYCAASTAEQMQGFKTLLTKLNEIKQL